MLSRCLLCEVQVGDINPVVCYVFLPLKKTAKGLSQALFDFNYYVFQLNSDILILLIRIDNLKMSTIYERGSGNLR